MVGFEGVSVPRLRSVIGAAPSEVPVGEMGESPVGGLCSSMGRQLGEVPLPVPVPFPFLLFVMEKRLFILQHLMQRRPCV